MMIRKLKNSDITLEYIETNAYWAVKDSSSKEGSPSKEGGREKLERLLAEGADTLCISIDPYHTEYVPYGAPLALAELCENTGMNYFLWKQEFLPALSHLDSKKTHSREDLETALSREYIHTTARRYGIGYGGRAINIEREFGVLHPAEYFADDSAPCRNLLSTGHFHVDKDCYFIPPRCTGIRIPLSQAIDGIPNGKYPVFETLYSGGISALLSLAREHGFNPGSTESTVGGYPSKCNLCFRIRSFLAEKDFPELDKNHYEEAVKYY
jgi:hypothetical protein